MPHALTGIGARSTIEVRPWGAGRAGGLTLRNTEHLDFAGRLAVELYERIPECDIRLSSWSGIEIICRRGDNALSQVFQIHELQKLGLDGAVDKVVGLTRRLASTGF